MSTDIQAMMQELTSNAANQIVADLTEFVSTQSFKDAFSAFLMVKYAQATPPTQETPPPAPTTELNTGQEPPPSEQPVPSIVDENPPPPPAQQPPSTFVPTVEPPPAQQPPASGIVE